MSKEKIKSIAKYGTLAAVIAMAMPEMAWAASGDLSQTAQQLRGQASSFAGLVNALFYLGGFGLVGAGLLKLKAHADNPGQTPMKNGVSMLGVGGALVAAPFMTNWANTTLGASGAAATYTTFNPF